MPKKYKRPSTMGLPPASFVYTGNKSNDSQKVKLYKYSKDSCKINENVHIKSLIKEMNSKDKYWLQITGLNRVDEISKIGLNLNISPLVIEDILDVSQRPKCEIFKDYLFFSLKIIDPKTEGKQVEFQQISFILKENLLISFQEKEDKWVKHLAERLEKNNTSLREKPLDYLFYRMLDVVVDYYFVRLDQLDEQIEPA